MTSAIVIQYISNTQLEAVYHARSEISVLPSSTTPRARHTSAKPRGRIAATCFTISHAWERAMTKLRELMEHWTASKDDKTIAWTLGIGWACNGGAMAGGSLVFAKATYVDRSDSIVAVSSCDSHFEMDPSHHLGVHQCQAYIGFIEPHQFW